MEPAVIGTKRYFCPWCSKSTGLRDLVAHHMASDHPLQAATVAARLYQSDPAWFIALYDADDWGEAASVREEW